MKGLPVSNIQPLDNHVLVPMQVGYKDDSGSLGTYNPKMALPRIPCSDGAGSNPLPLPQRGAPPPPPAATGERYACPRGPPLL